MNEKKITNRIDGRRNEPAEQKVIEAKTVEKEKKLDEQEIGELNEDIKNIYIEGLLEWIKDTEIEIASTKDEKRAEELKIDLDELKEQLANAEEFVEDIEQGNYEEITKKGA